MAEFAVDVKKKWNPSILAYFTLQLLLHYSYHVGGWGRIFPQFVFIFDELDDFGSTGDFGSVEFDELISRVI